MSATPDLLFNFIRDIIYEPAHARLDLDSLDPAFRDVGEGLTVLSDMLKEEREYAAALSRGEMHVHVPGKDNELASALKSLHASLKHITWQTQRVAAGDYSQKIDFMGEFAESFNSMVRELDTHKKLLEYEIEASNRKNISLENNIKLFSSLTQKIPQSIFVISFDSQDLLFKNDAAVKTLDDDQDLLDEIKEIMMDALLTDQILSDDCISSQVATGDDHKRYYSISMYKIQWGTSEAAAFVAEDVTQHVLRTRKLEEIAFVDELTKLYIRRYGMEVYAEWIAERKKFSICFVDLDFLKYVNDTFGHEMGDAYIKIAADLLRYLAEDAVVSRLGGDEFMLLIPDLGEHEITALMDGVQEKLAAAPQEIDTDPDTRSKLRFHASFGIVEVPTDGTADPSALLAEADEKMYEYKKAHKGARTI